MHQSAAPLSPAEAGNGPHQSAPQDRTPKVPGASYQSGEPQVTKAESCVGPFRRDLNLHTRVQRVERDLHCGRVVSDQDLLQHREDCTQISQQRYAVFEATHDPKVREEARAFMYRAQEATQRLSAEWKAAREAQIQQAIGAAFFIDAGDRGRAARAANEE